MRRLHLTELTWVWPRIDAAARKALEGADWLGEDILEMCRRRQALCFSCDDGVVVAELAANHHRHSEFELIVLLAVSTGPHGVVERYLPEIEEIARELGAVRIVFWSHRR